VQFHIVDKPELFPQADVIGDSSEAAGPYVDLNIELERSTHLYLGQRVVREIVNLAQPDLCHVKERDEALEEAKTARRYADQAEAQNVMLRVAAAQHQKTRDDLTNLQASYGALQTAYAAKEAGTTKTPQQRLSEATKPAPARKRAVGVKT
jgi:hypothetical protein